MRRRKREITEGQRYRRLGPGGSVWEIVAVRKDVMGATHAQMKRADDPKTLKTLAIAALLVFAGDNLWGFSIALFVGVLAGTYSSIYIANVVLIWLNLTTEDLIPPAVTEEVDERP